MYHALLALVALTTSVTACPDVKLATDATGWNCYQQASTQGISYQNVAGSGTYQQVTGMDMTTGQCTQKPVTYQGPLGPLSEELSVHFRGPVNLKRFAAYAGAASPSSMHKRSKRTEQHLRRHRRHASASERRRAGLERRACGDWVTATYPANGAVFSFQWEEGCPPKTTATPAPVAAANVVVASPAVAEVTAAARVSPLAQIIADIVASSSSSSSAVVSQTKTSQTKTSQPAVQSSTTASSSDGWRRTGFYDSSAQTANGVTFLANKGSGTGPIQSALTYLSGDGLSASTSAEILADTTVPSSNEFAIYSDTPCTDGSCAWSRPDAAAYHGFGGDVRAFVFEFSMPDDTAGGGNNMPAIWFLNAQLARTQQYAASDSCKCWPACGEVDVFETLAAGESRAVTAIHGGLGSAGISGGSTSWFARPATATATATLAVLFHGSGVDVQMLTGFDWAPGSGAALVQRVVAARATAAVTNNGGS